jgi:hypothetical protein
MSESKSVSSSGIGFGGLLAVVFITLKLCGVSEVATWSWWWVLSPLWFGWAIFGAVLVGFAVVTCVVLTIDWFATRARQRRWGK